MANAVEVWRRFAALLEERGLGWGLHHAPPHLRQARALDAPRGAVVEHLLPDDYREFVAAVGYPVVGFRYYDRTGLSFLPPEPMAVISVMIPTPDDEWPEPNDAGPVECLFALFAGYELSDIDGYAFGPDDEGELVVWEVEGGMPQAPLGSFSDWLADTLSTLADGCAGADAAELKRASKGETDPHRLLDYSLDKAYDVPPYSAADLALHWVESQGTDPYSYGLIDDGGAWLIPMTVRFKSVRPFRDGVAEVILDDEDSTYAGPWVRIRTDGTLAD